MKIALIIGHSALHQGAKAYNGRTEWEYNSHIAELVKKTLPEIEIYSRVSERFPQGIKLMGDQMQKNGVTHAMELHFNAIGNKVVAQGAMVLGVEDKWSRFAGEMFLQKLEASYFHNRGFKILEHRDRGFNNIRMLNKIGIQNILLEPTFMDTSHYESEWMMNNPQIYANILVEVINARYKF